jgi:WD40 repeat protein
MGIAALAGVPSLYGSNWAFTGIMPGGHRGPVNALVYKGDLLLSAGDDGFLEIWNTRAGAHAQERFQISQHRITTMVGRPEKDEVCLVENDGMGQCRVSAWNYKERRNIFSLQFRDPISHVFYSMGGSFIIAAGTGRTGLVFINADTGALLQSPPSFTGTVSFAATGNRNGICWPILRQVPCLTGIWNRETKLIALMCRLICIRRRFSAITVTLPE